MRTRGPPTPKPEPNQLRWMWPISEPSGIGFYLSKLPALTYFYPSPSKGKMGMKRMKSEKAKKGEGTNDLSWSSVTTMNGL